MNSSTNSTTKKTWAEIQAEKKAAAAAAAGTTSSAPVQSASSSAPKKTWAEIQAEKKAAAAAAGGSGGDASSSSPASGSGSAPKKTWAEIQAEKKAAAAGGSGGEVAASSTSSVVSSPSSAPKKTWAEIQAEKKAAAAGGETAASSTSSVVSSPSSAPKKTWAEIQAEKKAAAAGASLVSSSAVTSSSSSSSPISSSAPTSKWGNKTPSASASSSSSTNAAMSSLVKSASISSKSTPQTSIPVITEFSHEGELQRELPPPSKKSTAAPFGHSIPPVSVINDLKDIPSDVSNTFYRIPVSFQVDSLINPPSPRAGLIVPLPFLRSIESPFTPDIPLKLRNYDPLETSWSDIQKKTAQSIAASVAEFAANALAGADPSKPPGLQIGDKLPSEDHQDEYPVSRKKNAGPLRAYEFTLHMSTASNRLLGMRLHKAGVGSPAIVEALHPEGQAFQLGVEIGDHLVSINANSVLQLSEEQLKYTIAGLKHTSDGKSLPYIFSRPGFVTDPMIHEVVEGNS
jgi:hypothetical protein